MLQKKILSVIPYSIRTIRRISAASLQAPISFQQFRVLILIQTGHSQTEMAELLQVSLAAISKMINLLVLKKFAVRSQGVDRRCVGLTLTPTGKKIVKIVSTELETQLEKNIKKLSKQEVTQLNEGLIVLEKLIGKMNEN